MKRLITLTLLFLIASQTYAEDITAVKALKEYDVEIIIFEDSHARYLTSETWNQKNKNHRTTISYHKKK